MIRLLITLGDPAGIGPEVLLAALSRRSRPKASLTILGDLQLLRSLARRLRIPVPWSSYEWMDLPALAGIRPGRIQPAAGRAAHAALCEAVRRLRAGQAEALVTGPVSKEAIAQAGIPWRGHTEFLQERFHRRATMMFVTGSFRVSLVTTHWAIRQVPARLRRMEVVRVLKATREALVRDFGIRRPRLGLAALNPHAGEGGMFGEEERRVLLPAVKEFGSASLEGPLPADSLMQRAAQGAYDAVVALYHDQALIPVKLLGWDRAVNVTLGLPFVRTSPVHGTAFDLARTGKANPASMRAAISLAIQLAHRRITGCLSPVLGRPSRTVRNIP